MKETKKQFKCTTNMFFLYLNENKVKLERRADSWDELLSAVLCVSKQCDFF